MPDSFEHLIIEREPLQNDRRTRRINLPHTVRSNLWAHGQGLIENLNRAAQSVRQQITTKPGNYVLKLRYSGHLDFTHLYKHGVEFISQEEKNLFVAFADEQGLSVFAEHLSRLGLEGAELSYKQILEAIEGIDSWTADDRKSWAVKHKGFPAGERFELDIELWPVKAAQHPDRSILCNAFEHWLQEQVIHRVDKINLDSLLIYRVGVTPEQAELLLNHSDVRLVDLIPTTGISFQQLNRDINEVPAQIPSPEQGAARVCILDSGINTNHPLLRSAVAESASFVEGGDVFDQAGHGTAIAGIILYGDLEACNESNYWHPELWLFNGKILDFRGEFDQRTIEKTLVEAVTYFVEEHQCRIFNLSIGNVNAPYDKQHIRGIAYVLDKLARDFDILIIVSAGNFSGSVAPAVPRHSWRDEYPEYLVSEQSVIIDPASALNVLTVGSLAYHNATSDEQRYPEISQLSPAGEKQPSPFTRHGPSVKGALKPELVAHGGNSASPMRFEDRQWVHTEASLGVLTCNHQFVGNTLFTEVSGTSFAAPYITHLAGRLLNNYPRASATLLRALLVNHAEIPHEVDNTFPNTMRESYKKSHGRDIARDVAGYGLIDEDALYRSSQSVVVMMAEERIENNAHHFFEMPLPTEFLRTQRATREIRVALAYSPAVRTTRLDYIATRINFRLIKGASLEAIQQYFNHDTQAETETRNDDAISNRYITSQLRDKGTVQSSIWRFKSRKPNEKWFVVVTRQDRDWGEALSLEQEPYSLVVTVTDRENENAQLYTQISQRIQEQQRTRVRMRDFG